MIGELGSPKAIAKQIKADYASRILESEPQYAGRKVTVGHKLSAVWWVIIGICSAPVSIPIAICIGCVAFGILAAIFSVMISIYSAIIGVAAAGLAAFVAGFVFLPAAASSGVMTIGWFEDQSANGKPWYWFDDQGRMATGWKEIAGKWEKFSDYGQWEYTWNGQ